MHAQGITGVIKPTSPTRHSPSNHPAHPTHPAAPKPAAPAGHKKPAAPHHPHVAHRQPHRQPAGRQSAPWGTTDAQHAELAPLALVCVLAAAGGGTRA